MNDSIKQFEATIHYTFSDIHLLHLALTHPSCEFNQGNNQRLEFLGDAVLDLVVAEILYQGNPTADEGVLDHIRANLVNGRALAAHARALGIGAVLQVSAAQRRHHVEPSAGMLEDALEALIGAIYLDGGIAPVRTFILQTFGESIQTASATNYAGNPKGRLQEWTQQQHSGRVPDYITLSAEGPDHARRYRVAVQLEGTELGRGDGSSKKSAESAAAAHALQQLKL